MICSDDYPKVLFIQQSRMRAEIKDRALAVLKAALTSQQGEPWATLRNIIKEYPNDRGLFSPLLLNVITLQPGQAMGNPACLPERCSAGGDGKFG